MQLPTALARSARDDPAIAAWTVGLADRVTAAAARWSLDIGPAYEPGGATAWVATARTAAGADVVLKLAWRHDEAAHEADGLRVWAGNAAVRLLGSGRLDELTDVLLLEPCVPGTSASRRPALEADEVVAGVLRRLWITPPEPHSFRSLARMCRDWLADFDADDAARRIGDAGIVRAGAARFAELAADDVDPVLLATDLHAGNVLAAQREPWLAIDPKPYVGDRTFDVLQHLLNDDERLAADPAGFAARMAGLLDLDPQRVCDWLFARSVVEARWFPAAAEVARRLA